MSLSTGPTGALAVMNGHRPGIPMTRLLRVELRKLVNTRAGLWLTCSVAIASALIVAGMLVFGDTRDLRLTSLFELMGIPIGIILPVLAILLVTSEWSQRTGLVTFVLEPHRPRVVTAKLLTCLVAGAATVVVALGFAAVGTWLAGLLNGTSVWDLTWIGVANSALNQLVVLLWGLGFAMLIMNSTAAIVLVFALPTIWSVVSGIVPWLREHIQPWADLAVAQAPLQGGTWPSGQQWAHLGVAVTIWVVLPLALGTWRLLRSEVK